MNTIFIGGSRNISRLPAEVKMRLDNVVSSGHRVIIGDANGADKAVQKYFCDLNYNNVTVFCSSVSPRNNLGAWLTHHVHAPKQSKGFQFYAAKDRKMAREADFGLMVWDGKSPGTVLNLLRLAIAGKIAVLFNVPDGSVINIKSLEAWKDFISRCSEELRRDVKERATPDEWRPVETNDQPNFLRAMEKAALTECAEFGSEKKATSASEKLLVQEDFVEALNNALAYSDASAFEKILGEFMRDLSVGKIARQTSSANESLSRLFDFKGNNKFSNVLKALSSIGFQLEVKSEKAE